MSLSDIFRKSFLEGYANTDISTTTTIVTFVIVSMLALYIFCVYRIVTRKTFYSKTFSIAVAEVAVITAAIVLTMQFSIAVSLGMVGALSIVRFRTAIKDPLDLAFMFWAISVGIICGAGFAEIAVILSIVVTMGMVLLQLFPMAKAPMILIVNATDSKCEKNILSEVKNVAKYSKVKSRSLTASKMDMVIEVRIKEENDLVQRIMCIEGVNSVSLLSHDGEVTF